MKKPPSVWFFSEGDGICVQRCKIKAEALKLMQEIWNEDLEYNKKKYGDIQFTEDKVKEERYWYCRKCETNTLGEAVCNECDHFFTSNGRPCFAIYF